MMALIRIKQHLSSSIAQFMRKLSNTEADLKKRVAYIKKRVIHDLQNIINRGIKFTKFNFEYYKI